MYSVNQLGGFSVGRSGSFALTNSVSFDGSAECMTRGFQAAGDRTLWTFFTWFKRLATGSHMLFSLDAATNATDRFSIMFDTSHRIRMVSHTTEWLLTTATYSSTTTWHSIVVAFDASQGTDSNKLRLYVDNVEISAWDNDNRSSLGTGNRGINIEDTASGADGDLLHRIGSGWNVTGNALSDPANIRLAQTCFVDDAQLANTDFLGSGNAVKDISGIARGTTGSLLMYDDNGASGANLGLDEGSGTNDWGIVAMDASNQSTDVPV